MSTQETRRRERRYGDVAAERRELQWSRDATRRMRDLSDTRTMTRSAVSTPPFFVRAATRMAFGPTPSFKSEFLALGGSPEERFQAYVDQQLAPGTIDDSAFDARLAAAGLGTLNKSHTQLWNDHVVGNGGRYTPMEQVELATFMRAVYSKKQFREVMANFWHDHFNVYGWDFWVAPVMVSYDRWIRQNLFGNFRIMLEGIAKHSAMLYYLDNFASDKGEPNENYCRELFELHTLGAENYLGTIEQGEVPLDSNGIPIGYVDRDVFEAARCFTGWTVNNGYNGPISNGSFYFDSEEHDNDQKIVLNPSVAHAILPNDQSETEGRQVLNRLCSHPGTARYIARKLCTRLVSDTPSESLIDQAAQVFQSKWSPWDGATPTNRGQLTAVYRTILESDEFRDTWGEKTRRPFEIVTGTMRAASVEFDFTEANNQLGNFLWRFDSAGQPLFSWRTPDGYPDDRKSWESTAPRVFTWRANNWLSDERQASSEPWFFNVRGVTQAQTDSSANQIVDFWVEQMLRRPISSEDRDVLVNYMRLFSAASSHIDLDNEDNYSRLRGLISLIANSPYFAEK